MTHVLEYIPKLPNGVRLIGPQEVYHRIGAFSFAFDHHHPKDIADALADRGIAVRAGHHCTEPLHAYYGIPASLRMSLYIYNTTEDIDRFFRELFLLTA